MVRISGSQFGDGPTVRQSESDGPNFRANLTIQQITKMLSALTKKDRFSLFSSSFTNKTKTIIQLSQIFSIE
jgi:hypothetical protein